ncbi:hypothetical protein GGTG_08870 [Gaeumannomyces tritici R3-111a-1]|uniref:Rhodopsin domain-containing protein n=1 Tax=Gaeumannomyces tritici (strain R3-111a-1) TaxID=644352 RepID=J3P5T0_GAET3|nr:hypothetical protein GGTG_08870 [Gaeumannomyces tritici R3-111a-1]EJT75032.1 hypothetical protein GGTG_08870 [Gaeumannomyces tritici R3-111a-1]
MVAALRFLVLVSSLVGIVSAGNFVADVVTEAPKCSMACLIEAVSANGCSRELGDQGRLAACVCSANNTEALSRANICVQQKCTWNETLLALNVTLGTLCQGLPKESRGGLLRIIAIVALALTIPVVTLRILSRLYSSGRLWWDDYMSIAATASLVAMLALQFKSADLGFGTHVWNVDTFTAADLLKYYWAGQQLYIVVQVFAKISILILYMRLFQAAWFQWAVKGGIVFMALHGAVFLLLCIFQCLPVSAAWEPSATAKCLDFRVIAYAGGAFSIFEDFVLVLLPIPELMTMTLNWRKAIGLSFMFGFGLLATATSIVRMRYLIGLWDSYDLTWDRVDPILWSVMEQFTAIICGSLPSCRALVSDMLLKLRSRRAGDDTDGLRSRPGVFRMAPPEKHGGGFFNGRRGADLAEHNQRVAQGPEPGRGKPARTGLRDPYADLYDLDEEAMLGGECECEMENCPCALSPALCRSVTRRTSLGAQAGDPDMVAFQIHNPRDVVHLAKRGSSAIRPVSTMMAPVPPSLAGESTVVSHTFEFIDEEKLGGVRPLVLPRLPMPWERTSRPARPDDPDMVSDPIRSPEEVVEHSRAVPCIRPCSLAPTVYLGSASIGRAVSCGSWPGQGAQEGNGSGASSLAVPEDHHLTRIYASSSGEANADSGVDEPVPPIPETRPPVGSKDGSDV